MKKTLVLLGFLALLAVLFFVSPLASRVDLVALIHGRPPTATPGPPDTKTATVSFATGLAVDPQIQDFMQAFAEALRIHDGSALQPRLSSAYTIDELPDGHDPVDFFLQAMVKAKAPDEIVVSAIEPEGDLKVVTAEFRSPDRTKTRTFRFDAAGKLISADFFKLQRMHSGL